MKLKPLVQASALVLLSLTSCKKSQPVSGTLPPVTLLNVSYDPTREFYEEFNQEFVKHWQDTHGQTVKIDQSHGGSGKQARSVHRRHRRGRRHTRAFAGYRHAPHRARPPPADWQTKLPDNSSPYTSTIVFVVRKGNPKAIKDWGDLVKSGVQVITPNPKTGGAPRWCYLAGWAWGRREFAGDEAKVQDFIKRALSERPGSRQRCPRLHHHLRPARNRRRPPVMGKRSPPHRKGIPRPNRDCLSVHQHPCRTLRRGGREKRCEKGDRRSREGLSRLSLHRIRPGPRRQALLPSAQSQGSPKNSQHISQDEARHHRPGIRRLGEGPEDPLRTTAASSTRSINAESFIIGLHCTFNTQKFMNPTQTPENIVQTEYLSIGQLAAYLGWSTRFIEGLVRGERLPGLEIDGQWRFRRDDVVDWLEQKIQTLDTARVSELEAKMESSLLESGVLPHHPDRPPDLPPSAQGHRARCSSNEQVGRASLALSRSARPRVCCSTRTICSHLSWTANRFAAPPCPAESPCVIHADRCQVSSSGSFFVSCAPRRRSISERRTARALRCSSFYARRMTAPTFMAWPVSHGFSTVAAIDPLKNAATSEDVIAILADAESKIQARE